MRIAFTAPRHRLYLYSGTPSEPILAEAAARLMDQWRTRIDYTAASLQRYLETGLIEKGLRGELIARVLLTDTYDRAAKAQRHDSEPAPYNQPITLRSFFKELFTHEYAEVILQSMLNNFLQGSGKTLDVMLGDSLIRLSQWVLMGEWRGSITNVIAAALVRGMGIICGAGFKSCDLIIPIQLVDAASLPDGMIVTAKVGE